jgi:two-component system nitrogen regulation response regulator GlnG
MGQKRESIEAIVGSAPALTEVVRAALRIAPTRVPVLVSGESGTGKELLARLIHDFGPAPDGPFVAVNCGTLPREIADSELFGHERGAFTGAGARKIGWFEEADGGTLVLDEIGELPIDLQPKLLRVLESGRLRRVGGNGEISVRVRLVGLTLRDLPREIERGAFRADLYHRLAGFELTLPPLRYRPGDIAVLVRRFLDELEQELGPRTIDPVALARLAAHDWPGNVRQLRNVVRRAAINCPHEIVAEALDLPHRSCQSPSPIPFSASPVTTNAMPITTSAPISRLADEDGPAPLGLPGDLLRIGNCTFEEIERSVYDWALRRNGGSRRQAARSLGVARSTFCDKVKRYGLT